MINNWLDIIQPVCVLCQTPTKAVAGLCEHCLRLIPTLGDGCRQCASPLEPGNSRQLICGNCLREPPAFDRVSSLFAYAHPVDYLVQQMKFHARLDIARCFGTLLAARLTNEVNSVDALLPVPLHVTRLRQRGFNQALEIARPIARQHHLPIITTPCVRRLATTSQSDLPLHKRRQNVRNAFQLTGVVPYRRVAIIDDVMTTGQTAHSLSLTLKQHNVEHVQVWSCARTILDK